MLLETRNLLSMDMPREYAKHVDKKQIKTKVYVQTVHRLSIANEHFNFVSFYFFFQRLFYNKLDFMTVLYG